MIQPIIYDIETYRNYFMIGYSIPSIKKVDNKNVFTFKRDYVDTNNMEKLVKFLNRSYSKKDELVFIGYHNNYYDKALMEEAYNQRYEDKNTMLEKLYELSTNLVSGKDTSYRYNSFAQFDLQFSPSQTLKSCGVILHRDNIQELPYEPNKLLSPKEIDNMIYYNQENDLGITEELFEVFYDKFLAMEQVIDTFNLDITCFSMSERQIAEEVLTSKGAMGNPNKTATYKCPIDFTFKDKELQKLKEEYENTVFKYGDKFRKSIEWNGLTIDFALGGLHSSLPKYQDKDLIDLDFGSYYPNLIRVFDLLPSSVKDPNMYYTMITDRLALKKTNPGKATAYKVILNALYGALGYVSKSGKVGKLFDFNKLLTVTITGQLLIMKLAEDLHLKGHKVVYINTDGLMIKPKDNSWKKVIEDWNNFIDITLEEEYIDRCYLKDVNNYIVKKKDNDKLKAKGLFNVNLLGSNSLTSNYAKRRISIEAVKDYVLKDIPIEDTINNSNDIRGFVLHHKFGKQFVNRELSYPKTQLGRVVRWYKSNEYKNKITSVNKNTGNSYTAPNSDNISIINKLSDFKELPNDLDKQWYIDEAYLIYNDLTDESITGNEDAIEMFEELITRLKIKENK